MNKTNNYPCTRQTIETFYSRMNKPNEDIPSIQLTEDNVRDMETIWTTINELAPKWVERKKSGIAVPNEPINHKDFWGEFAIKHSPGNMPILTAFIDQSNGNGKFGLVLGSGKGGEVNSLLEKGWSVIAIDFSSVALEILAKNNQPAIDSGKLKVIQSNVTKYAPDLPVDLVVCQNILPYVNPGKFKALWEKIPSFLKANGTFIGSFSTTSSHKDQIIEMNKVKEVGGWFLPDRRMAKPLLMSAGYKIEKCIFYKNLEHLEPKDQLLIHFMATK